LEVFGLASASLSAVATRFCKVEVEGHLLIVRLNRPDQLNALHKEAHYELGAVFDAFERNPEHWVAILTGEGTAFCSGADLKSGPPTSFRRPDSRDSPTDLIEQSR
jgi:enoyl-CoA hydratase/carnithine racemase